ncbi:MAG: hypothetical protein LBU84_01155 [Prevotella sp.]|jgi:hypothetical protein|nr:hypothetical protein [Prevotella sp.]
MSNVIKYIIISIACLVCISFQKVKTDPEQKVELGTISTEWEYLNPALNFKMKLPQGWAIWIVSFDPSEKREINDDNIYLVPGDDRVIGEPLAEAITFLSINEPFRLSNLMQEKTILLFQSKKTENSSSRLEFRLELSETGDAMKDMETYLKHKLKEDSEYIEIIEKQKDLDLKNRIVIEHDIRKTLHWGNELCNNIRLSYSFYDWHDGSYQESYYMETSYLNYGCCNFVVELEYSTEAERAELQQILMNVRPL